MPNNEWVCRIKWGREGEGEGEREGEAAIININFPVHQIQPNQCITGIAEYYFFSLHLLSPYPK